jgi:predicted RNase H-related nuclease YkuK (DUF458 family)
MKILTISQGSSTQAIESNIVLRSGEFFKETDTNKVKIGDGSTPYRDLKFIIPIDLKVDGNGMKYLNDKGQYVELDLKTIDDKIEDLRTELIKALEDDEFVISQAINLLNTKHNELTLVVGSNKFELDQRMDELTSVVESNKSELDQSIDELTTDYNEFKDSTNQSINTQGQSIATLYEDLTETNRLLDEKIQLLDGKIQSLEDNVIENEEVIATAINLLHNKLTITEI